MKSTEKDIIKKIDLIVEKLINLDRPQNEEELTKSGGEAIGMFPRDFGIQEWDWPQGVGIYGLSKLNKYFKDNRYSEFLDNWYKTNLEIGLPSKNINTTAPLLTLIELADTNKEYEKLCLTWADWLMNCIPRTKEGGFQHVTSANGDRQGVRLNDSEMWIDTIFMTVLFLNKMGQKYNRTDWVEESIFQVLTHIKYLYDNKTGLFYHGWSFNENSNFGEIFWCRGNSWFTFGIIDFINDFRGTMPLSVNRYLINTYRAQVNALLKHQAKSGLWHTVIDDPSSYEETSGSAAITTGILKGIKLGILDSSYIPCAEKAIDGIMKNIDTDGTVLSVSGGTGMGYNADHYKNIIIAPMAYGQSLTLVALAEALSYLNQ